MTSISPRTMSDPPAASASARASRRVNPVPNIPAVTAAVSVRSGVANKSSSLASAGRQPGLQLNSLAMAAQRQLHDFCGSERSGERSQQAPRQQRAVRIPQGHGKVFARSQQPQMRAARPGNAFQPAQGALDDQAEVAAPGRQVQRAGHQPGQPVDFVEAREQPRGIDADRRGERAIGVAARARTAGSG